MGYLLNELLLRSAEKVSGPLNEPSINDSVLFWFLWSFSPPFTQRSFPRYEHRDISL